MSQINVPDPDLTVQAYNRTAAVRYALQHVFHPNPDFANMDMLGGGGDCTNFVSQCLAAGGWRMDYRAPGFDSEWWYRRLGTGRFDADNNDWWSCTWSLPSLFNQYVTTNFAKPMDLLANPRLARTLKKGDVIFYDWNGDGLFDHSVLVTSFRKGWPLVTYRTLSPLRPIRNGYWTLRFRRKAKAIMGVRLPNNPRVFPALPDWSKIGPCDQTRKG
jgi:cell wall-associated NlpC family hydrolase